MDFDHYVAARHGRLIEHAVQLGCADDEARAHVDRVLEQQRRRIGRAEDPDPLVREALEQTISGRPARRPAGSLAVLGVVAVAVAVGGTVATQPPAEPVPSLFGLTEPQAVRLLEDEGYDVELRPTALCDPRGQVVGSDPPAGRPAGRGSTVVVQTALPSESTCHGQYADRSAAWRFVSFALGGKPPQFAPDVVLLIDTDAPVTLTGTSATDLGRWDTVVTLIDRAAHRPAATETGIPALRVSPQVPPVEWCDTPRPASVAGRPALRIEFDRQTRNDEGNCPLTIDLYRVGDAVDSPIDAVVVYRAKFERAELAFAGLR